MPLLQVIVSQKTASRRVYFLRVFAKFRARVEGRQWIVSAVFPEDLGCLDTPCERFCNRVMCQNGSGSVLALAR